MLGGAHPSCVDQLTQYLSSRSIRVRASHYSGSFPVSVNNGGYLYKGKQGSNWYLWIYRNAHLLVPHRMSAFDIRGVNKYAKSFEGKQPTDILSYHGQQILFHAAHVLSG